MTDTAQVTKPLTINPRFKAFLDIPTEGERKELERQLVRDGGPRDPLVIWKARQEIVDGHNRYDICIAHDLPFKTVELDFADEDAVEAWMLENQLARRNLSPLRVTYFMGLLYNKTKGTGAGIKSEEMAEKFGVGERTVRRAGAIANGIDAVGKANNLASIREKLAAIQDKNAGFTKDELSVIGSETDEAVQIEAVKEMTTIKEQVAKAREASKPKTTEPKASTAPKPAKKDTYAVAFCKPAFDALNYNLSNEPRPSLAENAMVYIAVADEELMKGVDLLRKWGLTYEASFIFSIERYEGTWTDIHHMVLLCAAKGDVIGPKKSSSSLHTAKGDTDMMMLKLIDQYHPGAKKIDMRRQGKAPDGWVKHTA